MYCYIFNKSDQRNRLVLLIIFFLLGCSDSPINNDSGDTVGCTNEYACNYGAIDVCDFGTWCSDGELNKTIPSISLK